MILEFLAEQDLCIPSRRKNGTQVDRWVSKPCVCPVCVRVGDDSRKIGHGRILEWELWFMAFFPYLYGLYNSGDVNWLIGIFISCVISK